MRLYEIINFEPKDSKSTERKHLNNIMTKTNAKQLGSGHFSKVLGPQDGADGKRMNQVHKVGRAGNLVQGTNDVKEVAGDGYLLYLKAIHDYEQKGGQNPYFPRILNLTIRRKTDGNLYYTADIEKLYPFQNSKIVTNTDLMKSLYEQMFNDDGSRGKYDGNANEFVQKIEHAIDGHGLPYIKDKKLLEAINVVRQVNSKEKFLNDMHIGNIMWRITGNMPQLVITDPLS